MTVMTSEIRVQAGKQSNFTTAVTPTIALRGIEELTLRSGNDVEVIGDMTQALAGGDIGIVNGVAGSGSFRGWGSYEHIPYWLDNLFGEATPSGAGPYTRDYEAPLTSAPTPRIQTLVKGDGTVGAYRLIGALLSSYVLRFEQRRPLQQSGDLIGVSLGSTTLAALSAPTVNPILATHLSAITWDAWGGTMGSTALSDCFVRFAELTVTPDRASRSCFGNLAAQAYVERPWDGMLKLGLEFNATTKSDIDAIVAGTLTQKQVQLTASSGANSLQIQFAGTVQDDVEIFDDDDGVVTVNLSLQRTYHASFANWLKISAVNGLATLT